MLNDQPIDIPQNGYTFKLTVFDQQELLIVVSVRVVKLNFRCILLTLQYMPTFKGRQV